MNLHKHNKLTATRCFHRGKEKCDKLKTTEELSGFYYISTHSAFGDLLQTLKASEEALPTGVLL